MKTLNRIFATLFVTLIGFQAMAADDASAFFKVATVEADNFAYSIYSVKNAEKIKFAFEKVEDVNVSVKIYNEDFDLLYTDKVTNETEGRINYDFAELGKGTYHVKVSSKSFSKTHSFNVGEELFEHNFTPYLSSKSEDNKVQISFQNAFAPVTLKIYDADGVVYHDELITDKTYTSKINLDQLSSGDYTIELSSGGKSTAKTVNVQ